MKLTMDRKLSTEGPRLALTLTVPDTDARDHEIADQHVAAALMKALDLVQLLLFPSQTLPPTFEHPQETALFVRLADAALVRVALMPGTDVDQLPGLQYLPDAYSGTGKLLPVFWSLPLVDPVTVNRPPGFTGEADMPALVAALDKALRPFIAPGLVHDADHIIIDTVAHGARTAIELIAGPGQPPTGLLAAPRSAKDTHLVCGIGEVKVTNCTRCGHPADWHRHDDEQCLSTHPQPCSLPGTLEAQRGAPLAPFRCLGYDVEAPGAAPTHGCDCPDYQGS